MADRISEDLSDLAEAVLRSQKEDASMPCYGAHFENEVFSMRPFYWGDCDCGYDSLESQWCDANPHAEDCYYRKAQAIPYARDSNRDERLKALCAEYQIPWNDGLGCMVHCTCGQEARWLDWSATHGHAKTCCIAVPNFHHKPSGLEVRWYKYMGRGMEYEPAEPPRKEWNRIMDECMASVQP